MNKVQDFFKQLSGSDLPTVKVGIDTATLINLYLTITFAAATIMLIYFLLFNKQQKL